jgi:hypothetical protein
VLVPVAPAAVRAAASAAAMQATASSTSSVIVSSSTSPGETNPPASSVPRIQSTSGAQNSVPMSTTGNWLTFRVCTSVSASNSSSMVPKPPGRQTKPCEYFTNIVLRAKK